MVSVSIHEAKTQFSSLVSQVEASGEHVMICRHGRAVAEIIPRERKVRSAVDPALSNIRIKYDPTEPTKEEWGDV